MQLHRELSKSLLEETGIDVDFRVRSSLALAFTEADVRRLQVALPWQSGRQGMRGAGSTSRRLGGWGRGSRRGPPGGCVSRAGAAAWAAVWWRRPGLPRA